MFMLYAIPVIAGIYGLLINRYDIFFNSMYVIVLLVSLKLAQNRIIFKKSTYCCLILFVFLSVFAGRTLGVYEIVPHWDKMLHFLSGFICAQTAKELYLKVRGEKENKKLLSLFILSFSFAIAGLWEILEFLSDIIFKTNAQNNSLYDTMLDMIAGTSTGILSTVILLVLKKQ